MDMDRPTGRLPENGDAPGDEPASAAASEKFPELDDLVSDDDIIVDGGTQIMPRPLPPPKIPARRQVSTPPPPAVKPPALVAADRGVPSVIVPSVIVEVPSETTTESVPDDEGERRLNRTQRFDRALVFGAPPGDGVAGPPPQVASSAQHIPTSAAWPLAPAQAPQNRPTSIMPLAVDVAPAQTTPEPSPAIEHVPGVPKSNLPVIAAAVAGGFALCAALVWVFFSVTTDPPDGKAGPAVALKREAQTSPLRSVVIESPETTPEKAASSPGEEDEDMPLTAPVALPSAPAGAARTSPHKAAPRGASAAEPRAASASAPRGASATAPATPAPGAPAPDPEGTAAAPSPAPPAAPPVPAPPPRPAAPRRTTGTIVVPSSLMTVMVDGVYKRVKNGRVVVSCGTHRVNAGRGTQTVDVPCGGAVSVM